MARVQSPFQAARSTGLDIHNQHQDPEKISAIGGNGWPTPPARVRKAPSAPQSRSRDRASATPFPCRAAGTQTQFPQEGCSVERAPRSACSAELPEIEG